VAQAHGKVYVDVTPTMMMMMTFSDRTCEKFIGTSVAAAVAGE